MARSTRLENFEKRRHLPSASFYGAAEQIKATTMGDGRKRISRQGHIGILGPTVSYRIIGFDLWENSRSDGIVALAAEDKESAVACCAITAGSGERHPRASGPGTGSRIEFLNNIHVIYWAITPSNNVESATQLATNRMITRCFHWRKGFPCIRFGVIGKQIRNQLVDDMRTPPTNFSNPIASRNWSVTPVTSVRGAW